MGTSGTFRTEGNSRDLATLQQTGGAASHVSRSLSREKAARLALCLQPPDKTQRSVGPSAQFEGETDATDPGGGANTYQGWGH